MKCDECQALVEEYFDGELDQATTRVVSLHVENCSSCSGALEQLSFDQRAYQRYDRGLDVSPALWSNVQARLATEDSRQNTVARSRARIQFGDLLSLRFSFAASAALVVLAVGVTFAVMKYLHQPEKSPQIALSAGTSPKPKQLTGETAVISEPVKRKEVEDRSADAETKRITPVGLRSERGRSFSSSGNARSPKTAIQLVREAEKNYLSAIALLTRDARQRQSQFDPDTRAKLEGALAAIDRTILSTRKAVKRDPNDPLAVQYMLAAYDKKVDVLKEMSSY
jgi:hypothetical protein